MPPERLTPEERAEAAALIRRILAGVDDSNLTADGPAAVAMVRRLEGAALALEALDAREQSESPS